MNAPLRQGYLFVHDVFDECGHVPEDDTLSTNCLDEIVGIKVKTRPLVHQVRHDLCHGPLLVPVKDVLIGLKVTVKKLK